MMAMPFQNRIIGFASIGKGSIACIKMAGKINSAAHNAICTAIGMTGAISHTATPSINTPNTLRTAFIQAPALGSMVPAEAPIASSGAPMPSDSENSATPPNTTSCVLLI